MYGRVAECRPTAFMDAQRGGARQQGAPSMPSAAGSPGCACGGLAASCPGSTSLQGRGAQAGGDGCRRWQHRRREAVQASRPARRPLSRQPRFSKVPKLPNTRRRSGGPASRAGCAAQPRAAVHSPSLGEQADALKVPLMMSGAMPDRNTLNPRRLAVPGAGRGHGRNAGGGAVAPAALCGGPAAVRRLAAAAALAQLEQQAAAAGKSPRAARLKPTYTSAGVMNPSSSRSQKATCCMEWQESGMYSGAVRDLGRRQEEWTGGS